MPQPSHTSRQRAQIATLSCRQCQERKRKCDKQYPCQTCVQAGLACEPVSRARLARGRHVAPNANADSLRQRVARLEQMLSSRASDKAEAPERSRSLTVSPKQSYLELSDLKDEVAGIRELLDQSIAFDPQADYLETPQTGDEIAASLLFPRSMPSSSLNHVLPTPVTPSLTAFLLDIYTRRVDPIVKVIHVPTIKQYMLGGNPLTPPQLALKYAVLYCALQSLEPSERATLLQTEEGGFENGLRLTVECLLSNAGLISGTSLCTVQAFVIYIIGLRAKYGACREVWVLVATAVRVGQSLGLEAENRKLPPFDRELRSRTWHVICVLDLQAALDNGMHAPITILPSIPSPLHIDDSEMSPADVTLHGKQSKGFNNMTYACMSHVMLKYMRKMLHVPKDAEGNIVVVQDWESRRVLVDECRQELQEKFLVHCTGPDVFQQFTKSVGEGTLSTLALLMRRPIYRLYTGGPAPRDGYNILNVASRSLEYSLIKTENSHFRPWSWFFWPKWYVLAVLLAELCEFTSGENVEHAWYVARASFPILMEKAHDSRLRLSLTRLMERASAVKKTYDDQVSSAPASVDSYDLPITPEFSNHLTLADNINNVMGCHDASSWNSWEAFVQDLEVADPFPQAMTNGFQFL